VIVSPFRAVILNVSMQLFNPAAIEKHQFIEYIGTLQWLPTNLLRVIRYAKTKKNIKKNLKRNNFTFLIFCWETIFK